VRSTSPQLHVMLAGAPANPSTLVALLKEKRNPRILLEALRALSPNSHDADTAEAVTLCIEWTRVTKDESEANKLVRAAYESLFTSALEGGLSPRTAAKLLADYLVPARSSDNHAQRSTAMMLECFLQRMLPRGSTNAMGSESWLLSSLPGILSTLSSDPTSEAKLPSKVRKERQLMRFAAPPVLHAVALVAASPGLGLQSLRALRAPLAAVLGRRELPIDVRYAASSLLASAASASLRGPALTDIRERGCAIAEMLGTAAPLNWTAHQSTVTDARGVAAAPAHADVLLCRSAAMVATALRPLHKSDSRCASAEAACYSMLVGSALSDARPAVQLAAIRSLAHFGWPRLLEFYASTGPREPTSLLGLCAAVTDASACVATLATCVRRRMVEGQQAGHAALVSAATRTAAAMGLASCRLERALLQVRESVGDHTRGPLWLWSLACTARLHDVAVTSARHSLELLAAKASTSVAAALFEPLLMLHSWCAGDVGPAHMRPVSFITGPALVLCFPGAALAVPQFGTDSAFAPRSALEAARKYFLCLQTVLASAGSLAPSLPMEGVAFGALRQAVALRRSLLPRDLRFAMDQLTTAPFAAPPRAHQVLRSAAGEAEAMQAALHAQPNADRVTRLPDDATAAAFSAVHGYGRACRAYARTAAAVRSFSHRGDFCKTLLSPSALASLLCSDGLQSSSHGAHARSEAIRVCAALVQESQGRCLAASALTNGFTRAARKDAVIGPWALHFSHSTAVPTPEAINSLIASTSGIGSHTDVSVHAGGRINVRPSHGATAHVKRRARQQRAWFVSARSQRGLFDSEFSPVDGTYDTAEAARERLWARLLRAAASTQTAVALFCAPG